MFDYMMCSTYKIKVPKLRPKLYVEYQCCRHLDNTAFLDSIILYRHL